MERRDGFLPIYVEHKQGRIQREVPRLDPCPFLSVPRPPGSVQIPSTAIAGRAAEPTGMKREGPLSKEERTFAFASLGRRFYILVHVGPRTLRDALRDSRADQCLRIGARGVRDQ